MFSGQIPKCTCGRGGGTGGGTGGGPGYGFTECWIQGLVEVDDVPLSGCTYDTTINYTNDDSLANEVENGITENPFCLKALCEVGLTANISITFTCQEFVTGPITQQDFPMELTQDTVFPNLLACVSAT